MVSVYIITYIYHKKSTIHGSVNIPFVPWMLWVCKKYHSGQEVTWMTADLSRASMYLGNNFLGERIARFFTCFGRNFACCCVFGILRNLRMNVLRNLLDQEFRGKPVTRSF